MYFPGNTQQQIDSLVTRVAALEKPQMAADQNEYQNHTGAQTASSGAPYTSGYCQDAYTKVSGISGSLQGQTQDILKKSAPRYKVSFGSMTGKDSVFVEVDTIRFAAGFVVLSKSPSLSCAARTVVAVFPTNEVSSITKL